MLNHSMLRSFDGRLGKHTNGLEYDWRGDSLAYSTVDGNTGSLHAMQRGYTGWADTPDILNQYEAPPAPAAPEAPAVLAARATDDTCSSSDDDDGAVSFVQHRLPAPPDPEPAHAPPPAHVARVEGQDEGQLSQLRADHAIRCQGRNVRHSLVFGNWALEQYAAFR